MKKIKSIFRQSEFHALLFGFALFLFFFPIFRGDNESRQDLMYVYFFVVWAGLIFMLICISRNLADGNGDKNDGKGNV